jgi:hypothetical protein
MNGEVQLIVKIPGTAPSGIVTAVESAVIIDSTSPQQVFSYPNDMSAYLGGYVQIQSAVFGDLGTYYITAVEVNDPAYAYLHPLNTGIYTTTPWNFSVGGADLPNFNYMAAVPSVTEKYLDLFENESISQNWKFQDLNNFTAQGAFTREFRVPFSDKNQKALGALFDVNVEAGTENYFHYKLPAEIRVDTLPIATGYIRVRKVYKTMNRISEVELAFYAETPDLVRNIGEKKLSDIADLPSLNEEVSYANVTAPNTERYWTILDRGQLWSELGEANTRSLQDPNTPVYPADLTPAVNWWYLFNQIITDAGFDLVAGTLQNILETYYMPWCNSRFLQGSDTTGEFGFRAEVGTNFSTNGYIPFDVEIYDNQSDFNPATFTYTAPASGIYTFNLNLFIDKNAGSARVFIQAIINTTNVENVIDVNFFEPTTWNFTHSLTLNAGDSVQWFTFKQGASNTRINAGSTIQLQTANLFYSQTIFYPLNAPDMKQIDFVTDVIKMHNCAIVPDRAIPNKVYIVPQNSYLGSGAVLDWTSKLDTTKDIVIGSTTDLQKGKFQFTYTAGEDIISKVYRNVDRIYGDYEAIGYTINPNTSPSDFAIGEQKISLVTRSTPAGVVNGSNYIMPMFLNDSLQFVAPGPRCLFLAGSWLCQLYDEGSSTAVLNEIFTLNNYSIIYAEIDDEDLNWAPEVPPHTIISNPYNNLFNKYWRTYMNALYSPEARMMDAHFALTLSDILTFSFADKIWIQDSYWRIVEITDYKVGMYESTKVKLLKFLEDIEDCSGTPTSISLNGQVNFEDAGGDPVAPSQDCCVRYGYTWDENLGVCWANVPTGSKPNSPTTGSTTNPAPRRTAVQTRNSQITNSVINGEDVTIENGNKDMLAVGKDLTLTKAVEGSNLLGKNVYTNLPGLHLGGGYRDGSTFVEQGWAQSGTVILHRKDTYPAAGNAFYYVEGITNEHIELPNDTLWSCLLNVTIWDTTAGTYATGQYSFAMSKSGGVAAVSAITALNTVNTTAFTFTVGVNVAVATQHRLFLNVGGGGTFPANIITTASLQYQQSKIS